MGLLRRRGDQVLDDELRSRYRALEAAAEDVEQAQLLRSTIGDLERDVERAERKRDKLAAIGDRPLTLERESYDPRFQMTIRWRPLESALTGTELAAQLEADAAALRDELKRTRAELDTLLEG